MTQPSIRNLDELQEDAQKSAIERSRAIRKGADNTSLRTRLERMTKDELVKRYEVPENMRKDEMITSILGPLG